MSPLDEEVSTHHQPLSACLLEGEINYYEPDGLRIEDEFKYGERTMDRRVVPGFQESLRQHQP